jgi:hypothetical protein
MKRKVHGSIIAGKSLQGHILRHSRLLSELHHFLDCSFTHHHGRTRYIYHNVGGGGNRGKLTLSGHPTNYFFGFYIQGYSKRNIYFKKFILQKLLTLNPCPVYGWKGNLSKFWFESPPGARCTRNNSVCQGELCAVWEEMDYQFGICRVTRGAHIECL